MVKIDLLKKRKEMGKKRGRTKEKRKNKGKEKAQRDLTLKKKKKKRKACVIEISKSIFKSNFTYFLLFVLCFLTQTFNFHIINFFFKLKNNPNKSNELMSF